MDLAGVKAAVGPCYTRMLTWSQTGNIIKAVPKKRMSDLAFRVVKDVFRQLGGKYVRLNGVSYFELLVEDSGFRHISNRTPGNIGKPSPARSEPALTHLQAQLSRLAEADAQLVKEI